MTTVHWQISQTRLCSGINIPVSSCLSSRRAWLIPPDWSLLMGCDGSVLFGMVRFRSVLFVLVRLRSSTVIGVSRHAWWPEAKCYKTYFHLLECGWRLAYLHVTNVDGIVLSLVTSRKEVWGLCPGEFLSGGGVSVGEVPETEIPLCTMKSGRYTSYWNAFLFTLKFVFASNF